MATFTSPYLLEQLSQIKFASRDVMSVLLEEGIAMVAANVVTCKYSNDYLKDIVDAFQHEERQPEIRIEDIASEAMSLQLLPSICNVSLSDEDIAYNEQCLYDELQSSARNSPTHANKVCIKTRIHVKALDGETTYETVVLIPKGRADRIIESTLEKKSGSWMLHTKEKYIYKSGTFKINTNTMACKLKHPQSALFRKADLRLNCEKLIIDGEIIYDRTY